MDETVLTTEPLTITQGEALAWERDLGLYPAGEWTAVYRLRGVRGEGAGLDIACTASGTAFRAEVTAAETQVLSPTMYEWQLWVTSLDDPSVTRRAARGRVFVERGFTSSSTAASDTRSPAEAILEAIDAMIAGKATRDQQEFSIETQVGKRQLKRIPMTELIAARTYYAGLVARERQARRLAEGGGFFRNVHVRMRGENG